MRYSVAAVRDRDSGMHDIRNTDVYRKARRLVNIVYRETASFPRSEMYGLTAQMRKAANSIGANLMEGSGKNTPGEFRQSVGHATGSAYELEWHTIISGDVGLLPAPRQKALLAEIVDVKKLLYRFRESIR